MKPFGLCTFFSGESLSNGLVISLLTDGLGFSPLWFSISNSYFAGKSSSLGFLCLRVM